MDIILDKGFLNNFFKHNSTPELKPIFDSFIRFIKKLHKGFRVICDFEDIDELESYIKNNPLLNEMEDRNPEYKLIPELHREIAQIPFYEEGSNLKMFFLENNAIDLDQFEKLFGYSYISGFNFSAKWINFLTDKEIARYIITMDQSVSDEDRFDSWEKLRRYSHPINSIVVADRYILCNKDLKRIEHNLKPLLKVLIPNNKNLLPIDLTIISEQNECKQSFEQIKNSLEDFFKLSLPNININLTLIDLDDKVQAYLRNKYGSDFHDRRVVTSYYWFEAGKGFNLFKNYQQLNPSNSRMFLGFNFYGTNQVDSNFLLEEYAACAAVATQIVGSNKNRLLSPFQNIYSQLLLN